MASELRRIPPGLVKKYSATQDLLTWLGKRFKKYGDICGASIYGTNVYVVGAPDFVEHVLLKNCITIKKSRPSSDSLCCLVTGSW
jgi:hypothetical protein